MIGIGINFGVLKDVIIERRGGAENISNQIYITSPATHHFPGNSW